MSFETIVLAGPSLRLHTHNHLVIRIARPSRQFASFSAAYFDRSQRRANGICVTPGPKGNFMRARIDQLIAAERDDGIMLPAARDVQSPLGAFEPALYAMFIAVRQTPDDAYGIFRIRAIEQGDFAVDVTYAA